MVQPWKIPTVILPQLVLGPHPIEVKRRHWEGIPKIDYVVSIFELDDIFVLPMCHLRGIPRTVVDMHDGSDPGTCLPVTPQRLQAIARNVLKLMASGKVVYLHCAAGISRSPSVAVAVLMLKNGWSLGQAEDFVGDKRGCIYIKDFLRHNLKELEKLP